MVGLAAQGSRTTPALGLTLGLCGALVMIIMIMPPTATTAVAQTDGDWPAYGGQAAQDHYSSLSQITRGNVTELKVAWTFDTGESGNLETTPVIVGRVLYTFTPSLKV